MNRPPDNEIPTSSFGLPAEPGVAFDLLSDALLDLDTAARKDRFEPTAPPTVSDFDHRRLHGPTP